MGTNSLGTVPKYLAQHLIAWWVHYLGLENLHVEGTMSKVW